MPFTPFHMGAALFIKPALDRNFSVITFGIAQVAMDIEPGVRMVLGTDVLHGATHTILGALIIAVLVMLIAPGVCNCLLEKWNKEVIYYKKLWLLHSGAVSKTTIIMCALFGTLSHVLLYSSMHHDIHPLSPFSQAIPYLGLISHDGAYQACMVAAILGMASWLAMKWAGHARQAKGEKRGT